MLAHPCRVNPLYLRFYSSPSGPHFICPTFRNGSNSRDSLPLWYRLLSRTLDASFQGGIVFPSFFHNCSKAHDSQPLRKSLFSHAFSTPSEGVKCAQPWQCGLQHSWRAFRESTPSEGVVERRDISTPPEGVEPFGRS